MKNDKAAYFYNATNRYIEHGSIKRIIPHTGEVAITYNNGILLIINPPSNNKPIIINSPTHQFDGFISTSLQTLLFPSEDTKKQTFKDNKRASPDEMNFKTFQTRDSLRVGVILVVAFKISNPEVAITKLGKDGILPHVENIAFADMGKAIQLNTLQEVLYSTQNKLNSNQPNMSQGAPSIQDIVRKNLAVDLEDYGIELVRLNIESIKVLDGDIAKKLAGQSVTSAEFTTKQATLVKEYDIKTTEARLRAETDNIVVQQKNQAVISQAQAKLDAARIEAEALLIAAQAQQTAQEMLGKLYERYPRLLEVELVKIKAQAIQSAKLYVTPQTLGNFMNSPTDFFQQKPTEEI
jgi:regulator of protease activity HflC (stomatin/prohibitin superfamily)